MKAGSPRRRLCKINEETPRKKLTRQVAQHAFEPNDIKKCADVLYVPSLPFIYVRPITRRLFCIPQRIIICTSVLRAAHLPIGRFQHDLSQCQVQPGGSHDAVWSPGGRAQHVVHLKDYRWLVVVGCKKTHHRSKSMRNMWLHGITFYMLGSPNIFLEVPFDC